jgi:hypothetical protein
MGIAQCLDKENLLQLPVNLGGHQSCFSEARRSNKKKSNGNFTLVLCLLMIRSQNGASSPLRLFLLLRLGWLQYHLNSRIEDTLYVLQIRWAEESPLVCLHFFFFFCICNKQLSR